MAADAPWKTWQMSALRPCIEISNDWKPHFLVLRALPEAKVTQASNRRRTNPPECEPDSAGEDGYVTPQTLSATSPAV
jgi:hypothetical protein